MLICQASLKSKAQNRRWRWQKKKKNAYLTLKCQQESECVCVSTDTQTMLGYSSLDGEMLSPRVDLRKEEGREENRWTSRSHEHWSSGGSGAGFEEQLHNIQRQRRRGQPWTEMKQRATFLHPSHIVHFFTEDGLWVQNVQKGACVLF